MSGDEDTSVVRKSNKPPQSSQRNAAQTSSEEDLSGYVSEPVTQNKASVPQRTGPNGEKIRYKAAQVISRNDPPSAKDMIKRGSNFIGKLLTAIDTRESGQLYKALLPYGGSNGSGPSLAKNTVLFGSVNYSGKGKKVFMQFSRAQLPNGREFEIKAQALDPGTYAPGLIGEFHSKAGVRLGTGLGLTVLSGAAEALTEKEALGDAGVVTPKSTLKNAIYSGLAKSSEREAARQMQEMANEPEYVTIEAGADVIVSLVEPLSTQKKD